MGSEGFLKGIIFHVGALEVSGSVVMTWILMLILGAGSWIITRTLSLAPRAPQAVLEGTITAIQNAIEDVLPGRSMVVLPFIATLWIFIMTANLIGLIPGLHSPTGDLSVTAALAILVFLSVHWFGIRSDGFLKYLRHYLQPSPILLPFHLVSEFSRTLALAVRLFGNVMSLEIATLLVLMIAGFLAPIPLLMLHIVEGVIQGYLFGMLALIYIAGGIQAQEIRKQKEGVHV